MKPLTLTLPVLALSLYLPAAVQAADVMVPAAMQRCSGPDECVMVSNVCGSSCPVLPINKAHEATVQGLYQTRCGATPEDSGACTSGQKLEAACVSGHCTIAYTPPPSAPAGDPMYKPGAYPVPESPVEYQGANDYSEVNDTDGNFSAYDLPKDLVRQNALGQYKIEDQ